MMRIFKQSYSDTYNQSYSDLFRVSIDPRVKPEGDRKESVHEGYRKESVPEGGRKESVPEGGRKESVPEGDRKESVPEGDERGRKPPYDNLKKSSHRVVTRGQTIFELEKNKIGRSLDDCYRNRGMTVKNKCNIEMTVKNKCNRVVAGEKLQKIGMAVWMILLLVSSTSIVRAACTPTPDCASMGYTETSCDGKFVRCPFDTSKLFCVPCDSTYQYACSGEGYSGGEGRACNNKYISCVCADGYEWDGRACIANCPQGYSTSVTSCGSGYSFATSGYSGSNACGICFSNSTGCPSGYMDYLTLYTTKGLQYSNNIDTWIYSSDKTAWCAPESTIKINNSVSALSIDSTYLVTNTGTITVSNEPLLRFRLYGNLTVNGDFGLSEAYFESGDSVLRVNGRVKIRQGVYLTTGAKFCPQEIDLSMVAYEPTKRGWRWCVKNWSGWGDSVGSGDCDFDGECYY